MSLRSVESKKNTTWRSLYAEFSCRILEGMWRPGDIIPGEVDLAIEFGCARATVNRALRELADEGVLDRRRKAGTRVALHPIRKATLDISITRREVEQRGGVYEHILLDKTQANPPRLIQDILGVTQQTPLHIRTLHKSDGKPFMYEDRWVNTDVTPSILTASFIDTNVNEWLVEHALFTRGDIAFSAANASQLEADILEISEGEAIFVIDRTTWNGANVITCVRLAYAPKFLMKTSV